MYVELRGKKDKSQPEFFASKIYNQGNEGSERPVFSFLSQTENFGLEEAKICLAEKNLSYLFVLINGQQNTSHASGSEIDRQYGRKLTGAHRIPHENSWAGKYRIYNSNSAFPSTAAWLFDRYGSQALVLDVLDPRFDWEKFPGDNRHALDNLTEMIQELLGAAAQCHALVPQIFIAGFSRGGVFSLRLAESLKSSAQVKAVVTLDPVIARWKEGDEMVEGWGIQDGEAWHFEWGERPKKMYLFQHIFPVLRSPGVPCYNVFQRRSFHENLPSADTPIGSAIRNAVAPAAGEVAGFKAAGSESPLDQYDVAVNRHSSMIEKYARWIVELARRECPPKNHQ